MMPSRSGGTAAGLLVLAIAVSLVAVNAQEADRRHPSGQTVTPSFEGWYRNTDGSFGLVFGYFNRNFDEELELPVGPNNLMEPGPADRGQPTHFLTRRQVAVFAVTVPPDFGQQTLTWTLVSQGQRLAVPGSLRAEWEITPFRDPTNGRTPPQMRFASGQALTAGPAGPTERMTFQAKQPGALKIWAQAGHPPDVEEPRQSRATPIVWSLYRGSGHVRFGDERLEIEGTDRPSPAATTVTFDEPGMYRLRVMVGQATTSGCCWTNGYVDATVE